MAEDVVLETNAKWHAFLSREAAILLRSSSIFCPLRDANLIAPLGLEPTVFQPTALQKLKEEKIRLILSKRYPLESLFAMLKVADSDSHFRKTIQNGSLMSVFKGAIKTNKRKKENVPMSGCARRT